MYILEKLGDIVESYSYNLKPGSETDFNDGIGGSWYISPKAHGVEFVTITPFYLIMTVYFGYKALLKNKINYQLLTDQDPGKRRTWIEVLCLLSLIVSYSITVTHKVLTGTEIFLLQPCHVSAAILIMIQAWPSKLPRWIPRLLFNIYLHTLWGAVLALIFPDLRDHDMLGEIFNFFLEHGLILVVPFYLLYIKRITALPKSVDVALFNFFLYAAYHSPLLHAVSLWSGYNVNYTLVPPTIGFLMEAGQMYRFYMYLSALLLMFITRFIVVETFLKAFVDNSAQQRLKDKKRKL